MNVSRLVAAAPSRASGRCRFADLPDRRGEALAIFTTIFIRPALELKRPARRLVGALADAGGRMVAGRFHDRAATPARHQ